MQKPLLGRDGLDGNCGKSHTLALKCPLSICEETLGKLRVWIAQEKCKRDQREFVKVDNLWAAQRKFLFDQSIPL